MVLLCNCCRNAEDGQKDKQDGWVICCELPYMTDSKQKEWNRHYEQASTTEPQAARVLIENQHLLPSQGRALDLACGLGGNALLLAAEGLETHAYDQSPVAIDALRTRSEKAGLSLVTEVRDVENHPPERAGFDVIVVSYFLHRSLFPYLLAALRPSGLLFYQTFSGPRMFGKGPRNPDFRLQVNELLQLCGALQVLVFREEGMAGNLVLGLRQEALLVARAKSVG